jgi:hypothetical protein
MGNVVIPEVILQMHRQVNQPALGEMQFSNPKGLAALDERRKAVVN